MLNLFIIITLVITLFHVSKVFTFQINIIIYYFLFLVPPPKFYVQVNPISVVFDVDSCLWLNSFGLNLYQSLMNSKNQAPASNYTYIDVKVEAILPKVCIMNLLTNELYVC